jgi:hypothetical protein
VVRGGRVDGDPSLHTPQFRPSDSAALQLARERQILEALPSGGTPLPLGPRPPSSGGAGPRVPLRAARSSSKHLELPLPA